MSESPGFDEGGAGRVALVTGAARGIGAAVSVRLARSGWHIVAFDVCADDPCLPYHLAGPEDLRSTVEACQVAGGGEVAVGVVGDVRDQKVLEGAVATARNRFGGLDAAISVAGVIGGGQRAWEIDDRLWQTMVDVNLGGVRRLAQASVPAMLDRPVPRAGRFVAVASAAGSVGLAMLGGYVAAKHGVVGLVRTLAAELAPEGITANVVSPGSTRTHVLTASAALYGLDDPDEFNVHHLEHRLLEPHEIAAAVVWLCGPASSGITGAVVPVDAGMTAR